MKKILLICLWCLCLCGCEEKKQEEMLHCTFYANEDYSSYLYSTEIKDFYFDNNGIANKMCYDDTFVYDTVEAAIEGFKFYGYLHRDNASLEGTIIRVNYCTDELNENGKNTLSVLKSLYEQIGYECTIKDAN